MRSITIVFLFISIVSQAQLKSYILGRRGDTLNRVDQQNLKQGPWVVSVPEYRGERAYEEEGSYLNDLKEGLWKRFSLEGVKIAEENYRWGKLNGKQQYFSYNGGLMRIENWRAFDPAKAYDTVSIYDLKDPDKEIDRIAVKNEGPSMKHGVFTYYDPRTGNVLLVENYIMNKLQDPEEPVKKEPLPKPPVPAMKVLDNGKKKK
jgi:hypothetical protein